MDNNAFRTLVNQQLKSTKEIAREAVESEFRQKKQKRGGGRRSRVEYDSDSASDDDDLKRRREGDKKSGEEVSDEPEWKRRRKEKAAATTGGGGQQWRDRAKERREGKNLDYNDAVTTATIHSSSINGGGDEYTDKKRQAELSKFLGGDEEHTHLVKGLDLALAQKVRREEMGAADAADGREEDLDQLLEDAYNTQQKEESLELKSKQSSSIAMIQPKSELGKSVQHYLLKKQQQEQQLRHNNHSAAVTSTQQQSIQINSTKQNSIQRSHYTFSLDSTIQKRHDAWDVPQLQMIGGGGSSGQQEQSLFEKRGMTPLDCHLIATIRKKLDGAMNKGGVGGKRKEMNDGGVERIGNIDNVKQLHQQEVHGKEQIHQEDNVITEKTLISNLTNSKKDDSDDDD
ncbi:RED-like protein N-terminal region-containing protein, partial [Skeletonema marinoi]